MPTTTPRLGLIKPTDGGDDDLWGPMLNTNSDTLDSQMATQTQLGLYLPLATGGTLQAPLRLPDGTLASPGLKFGLDDGTGISRTTNALAIGIQGSMTMALFPDHAQFYSNLGLLNNRIVQLGDPTAATDAINLRTADARYMTAGAGPFLPLTGGLLSGGLNLGAAVAPGGVSDLSRHLTLYDVGGGTGMGLNITPNRLNYSVTLNNSHYFVINGADVADFSYAGLTMGAGTDISLSRAPTQNMHAVTKTYVDTNFPTIASGDARWMNITGDTATGPYYINMMPTDINAQLVLRTPDGYDGGEAKLRFMANFRGISDTATRAVCSIRAGFYPTAWTDEYLDIWFNNTANDALSDLNQSRVARFTLYKGINFDVPLFLGNYLSVTNGIRCTGPVVTNPADVSKHIDLYGGAYGFSISANRLNIVSAANSAAVFVNNGVDIAQVGSTGLAVLAGGLGFGARFAAGPTDLSQHISLFDGWGGFSITGGALNIVAGNTLCILVAPEEMRCLAPMVLSRDPSIAMECATKQYVDGKSGVASFNTRAGAVTLTSGDVTTALTFVPYNATNPSSYQTAAQVSATVSGYLPLAGGTVNGSLHVTGNLAVDNRIVSQANPGAYAVVGCKVQGVYAAGMHLDTGASLLGIGHQDDTGTPLDFPPWMFFSYAAATPYMQLTWGAANKPGGGPWADTSDARIKTVTGDYDLGLDAVLKLRPVRYRFKGNDKLARHTRSFHADTTREYIGLVAQDVEGVFPEMVRLVAGVIDDEPVDDLRSMDLGSLPLALVNAIRELDRRTTQLEQRKH
jgi:hypothetical protein